MTMGIISTEPHKFYWLMMMVPLRLSIISFRPIPAPLRSLPMTLFSAARA